MMRQRRGFSFAAALGAAAGSHSGGNLIGLGVHLDRVFWTVPELFLQILRQLVVAVNKLGPDAESNPSLLVFGRRAGLGAAEYANEIDANTLNIDEQQIAEHEKEILAPFNNTGGENPYTVHQKLQEIMQNYFT